MVRVLAVEELDVKRDPASAHESREKFLHKLRVEIANLFRKRAEVEGEHLSARNVNSRKHERFVHRERYVAVAHNAAHVKLTRECVAKANAYVLCRVVVVNVNVARAFYGEVKAAVYRKKREHMVKEAAARVYLVLALAVHSEGKKNVCFSRFSFDFRHSLPP